MMCKRRYNKKVVELGHRGLSATHIASRLGVTRTMLNTWARKYPEFADALALAKEASLAYWEAKVQKFLEESARPIPKQGPEFSMRTRRKHRRRHRAKFNDGSLIKELERRFPRQYGHKKPAADDRSRLVRSLIVRE